MSDATHESARTVLQEAVKGRTSQGVEIARGQRPNLLDADGARALSAPFLAAFMVAAAVLRARIAHSDLDLLTLLLHTAAFAFCVRAILLVTRVVLRLRADLDAAAHTLAFSADGLIWNGPHGERFVARADVLGVCVPELRASRFLPEPQRALWIVTRPETGTLYWAIPAYFSTSPEILAARLTRTLKPDESNTGARVEAPPVEGPQDRYARAASGRTLAGETVIPEGHGYRRRGPYGVLLGLVFALDALLSAPQQRAILLQPVLLSCLLALGMPAIWLWLMKRKAKARLGIAMLLTREELLVRGKHGVVSVPWSQLGDVEVRLRDAWSPFVGTYTTRTLLIATQDGSVMTFDAGFLGVPAEVVARLCAAYRSGALNPQEAS